MGDRPRTNHKKGVPWAKRRGTDASFGTSEKAWRTGGVGWGGPGKGDGGSSLVAGGGDGGPVSVSGGGGLDDEGD